MPLTAAQICTIARQVAKCPGYTAQSGELLNAILNNLCQTYDFDVARGTTTITLGSTSGPYNLAADYLRTRPGEMFYPVSGVPYVMINISIEEYDRLVQQAGINAYPEFFATRMETSPPSLYVWPPPSGAYVVTNRYQKQMPDITTPETATDIPWFPNQQYLLRQLEAELMTLTDDDRQPDYEKQAADLLRNYLELKDDSLDRAKQVSLDKRSFGLSFNRLPNTKTIGW